MSLGQVQTVIVCQSSQTVDQFGLCPQGQSLTTIQAYVLDASSQSQFETSVLTDYTIPAEFFSLGISVVLTCWLTAKGFGYLVKLLK